MADRVIQKRTVKSPVAAGARTIPPPPTAWSGASGKSAAAPARSGAPSLQAAPARGVPPRTVFGSAPAGAAVQQQAAHGAAQRRPGPPPPPAPPPFRSPANQAGPVQRAAAPQPAFIPPGPPRPAGPPGKTAASLQARPAAGTAPGPPAQASRSGRVMQCILEITDTKKIFTDKAAAEAYLSTEYKNILQKNTPMGTIARAIDLLEQGRLKEVAGAADDKRYVYPIPTLDDAMQYIATGKNINAMKYDTMPDQTPQRDTDDSTPWNFVLHNTHTPPINMEVPQSPTHERFFPTDIKFTPQFVDLLDGISDVRNEIHTWKKRSKKSHIGKNHYSYRLTIKYRLDKLETFTDVGGNTSYGASTHTALNDAIEQSKYYTSKKEIAPQKIGEKPIDIESNIRDELTHLHTHYDRDKFQETSMFATDKSGIRTKTAAFYKSAKIGQLSSLYFHSEVQAASDQAAATKVAVEAVNKTIREAINHKKAGHYNLVIVAAIIKGYSDNRTVCGNACKPALSHLSEIIAQEMDKQLKIKKIDPAVKTADLHIRRSAKFRVSAHVGAAVKFQGLQTGAQLGGNPTVLPHNQVNEYDVF